MEIKNGDWAILRNGQVAGPIVFDADMGTYPYFVKHGGGFVTGPWTRKGRYKTSEETLLDIVETLPCSPLERIKQLEEALRDQVAFCAMDLACLKQARDPDQTQISDIEYRRDQARQALGISK